MYGWRLRIGYIAIPGVEVFPYETITLDIPGVTCAVTTVAEPLDDAASLESEVSKAVAELSKFEVDFMVVDDAIWGDRLPTPDEADAALSSARSIADCEVVVATAALAEFQSALEIQNPVILVGPSKVEKETIDSWFDCEPARRIAVPTEASVIDTLLREGSPDSLEARDGVLVLGSKLTTLDMFALANESGAGPFMSTNLATIWYGLVKYRGMSPAKAYEEIADAAGKWDRARPTYVGI